MVCWLALAIPRVAPDGTARSPRIELFSGDDGRARSPPSGAARADSDTTRSSCCPSGVTTAELPEGEKDLISHRGRAVAAALPRLRELLAAT